MKVISWPHVHLAGAMQFFDHPEYKLPSGGTSSERLIAMGGKGCYDSYGEDGRSIDAHIRSLVDSGHGSVLEHAHVSLFISGISRGCSHEIVRHRLFNYSQRSTRYTAEEGAAIVLDPYYASLPSGDTLVQEFIQDCQVATEKYADAVQNLMSRNPEKLEGKDLRKWARGKARQLLPHALETRMLMTGNLRGWRDFIEARTSRHAEPEIRRLAEEVFYVVKQQAPSVFADAHIDIVNNYHEVHFKVRKV